MSAPQRMHLLQAYKTFQDIKALTKRVRLNPCKAHYSDKGFLWDGEMVHVLLQIDVTESKAKSDSNNLRPPGPPYQDNVNQPSFTPAFHSKLPSGDLMIPRGEKAIIRRMHFRKQNDRT